MNFIIIYITHPDMKTAKKIVASLMKSRLIACANLFPIQSAYWWEGKIKTSKEIVSIVKTKKENWEKVKAEVKKIHPYKIPCIVKLDVEANEDYEKWVMGEVR